MHQALKRLTGFQKLGGLFYCKLKSAGSTSGFLRDSVSDGYCESCAIVSMVKATSAAVLPRDRSETG